MFSISFNHTLCICNTGMIMVQVNVSHSLVIFSRIVFIIFAVANGFLLL